MPRFLTRVWQLCGLLASALALGACGGGGGGDPEPPPVVIDPIVFVPYTLDRRGAAINATVTPDTARAASADLPVTGGTLSVTGADGTVYTLEIPADALVEATRVTLTPVVSVAGLPIGGGGSGGGTSVGVQLSPAGLQLVNAATLVITPAAAAAVPIERQLFIQWGSGGNDVAYIAPDPAAATVRLSVAQFSGVGMLRSAGFDVDTAALRTRIGGDAAARLASAVAELLMRDRARRHAGITDTQGALIAAALTGSLIDQFRRDVLTPRTAAAASGCAAATLAADTLTQLHQQRRLLGVANAAAELATEATALMPVVAEACMAAAYAQCRDAHVVTRVIPAQTAIARRAALLGSDVTSFPDTDRFVRGCLRFELEFVSSAGARVTAGDAPYDFDEAVAATVPIDLGPGQLGGTATLASTRYDVVQKNACLRSEGLVRVGSQLTVAGISFVTAVDPVTAAATGTVTDLTLNFSAEPTASTYTLVDTCLATRENVDGATWSTVHAQTMDLVLPPAGNGYAVSGWQMLGGAVFARKTITVNSPQDGFSLLTESRLELRHTPGL